MELHVVAICGLVWCVGDTAAWGDATVTSPTEQLKRMGGELHLIKGYMDNRFNSLELSLKEERDTYRDNLIKLTEEFNNRLQGLEVKLNTTSNALCHAMAMNSELRQELIMMNKSCGMREDTNDIKLRDKTSLTNTSSHVGLTTPSETLTAALEERSRLLVVPHRIRKTPAKEIQLDNNSLQNFPSIDLKGVWSITYVSKLRQVLLATHSPARISSYQLDTKDTRSVKTGVVVNGMGVDEGRQLVFLSTRRPNVTVSRMSTNGRHFRNIARVEWLPYSVAVDAQSAVIYVACTTRLVSMDYEGQRLKVVFRGDYMYSASWDPIASAVYFNNFTSVMKMTPGDSEATEVYELSYVASNVVFYNRTIYIGSYCGRFVDALHLDEDNTTVYNNLQTLPFTYYMNICLLP